MSLSYTETGRGSPVILLDWTPWQSPVLADALSEKYRVLSMEPPPDAGAFATVDYAASALAQVAESAGLDSYALVGASLGADVALRVALLRPASVATLALVSPTCVQPGNRPPLNTPVNTPELAARMMLAHPEDTALPPPDAGKTEALAALAEEWQARGYASPELLSGLTAATLVVFGQEDYLVSRESGGVWKERVPNCSLCYVYDAGHAIAQERPDALVNVVLDFVERRETFIVENRSSLINP